MADCSGVLCRLQVEQLELQLKMSEEAILEKMSAMLGGK